MNLDESNLNPAADILKSFPITRTPSRYGTKTLTMDEQNELIIKCNLNIALDKIETDVENTINNFSGPWSYKYSKKTWIHYHVIGSSGNEPDKIRLDNLRSRGFPTTYNYKCYSWLRFKDFAQKHYTDVEQVLADKSKFLDILYEVNFYYQKNPEYPKQEGLELYKGPQTYDERTNKEALPMAKVGINGIRSQNLKSKC